MRCMGFAAKCSNLAIVRATPARRLWLGAAGVAVFIATVWTAHAIIARPETQEPGFGLDFIAFYTAGSFVDQARLNDLYNLEAVHQFQRQLAAASSFDIGRAYGPWWNPPFYALVFAPLARLPYQVASAIWISINLVCFALACTLLCRFLPDKTKRSTRALVPVLTILSAPFILAISHAQNTCTSLLLLTLTVIFWRNRRPLLAGAVGGLMFYKPQVAAVLACVLVIDLGWKAAAGYALTGAGLLAANLILLPGTLADYLHRLPGNVRSFQTQTLYPWEQHVTLKAFWRLLLQGHSLGDATTSVTALTIVSGAVIAAMLLGVLMRTRTDRARDAEGQCAAPRRDRLIAAAVVATPLLMPFYFDYDLLLLAVPAVLFAADQMRRHSDSNRSADRWIIGAWISLYAWQMVNTDFGAKFHLNLSVPLLTVLASMMIVRATRREASDAIGDNRDPEVTLLRAA